MKIEILKVQNGQIVDPDWSMHVCMIGCGGGGGGGPIYSDICYNVCAAWGYIDCASDASMK